MIAGATFKTGVVIEAQPGYCRVRFADLDDLTSAWLPVVYTKTLKDKMVWTLDVGEHVACLMDTQMEDGVVLGAIYSRADTPPTTAPLQHLTVYEDGTSVVYDKETKVLHLQVAGCSFTFSGSGLVVDGGDVVASDISLREHVHKNVMPGPDETGAPK